MRLLENTCSNSNRILLGSTEKKQQIVLKHSIISASTRKMSGVSRVCLYDIRMQFLTNLLLVVHFMKTNSPFAQRGMFHYRKVFIKVIFVSLNLVIKLSHPKL